MHLQASSSCHITHSGTEFEHISISARSQDQIFFTCSDSETHLDALSNVVVNHQLSLHLSRGTALQHNAPRHYSYPVTGKCERAPEFAWVYVQLQASAPLLR